MSKVPSELDRIIARVRELIEICGRNKHEQVIAAISALIYEGIRSRREIISILVRLAFDRRHVAITLKRNTGRDPVGNHWWVDADGQLRVHD